jgi:hypothetical protein
MLAIFSAKSAYLDKPLVAQFWDWISFLNYLFSKNRDVQNKPHSQREPENNI